MRQLEIGGGSKPSPGDPHFDYKIVFDGGAIGNPGKGYGSYQISVGDAIVEHRREDFGGHITNNQAEYMTLIRSLRWLAARLGSDVANTSVEVWGDSQLVINQLNGSWKVRNAALRPLVCEAQHELDRFDRTRLTWHPRAFSVAHLGH